MNDDYIDFLKWREQNNRSSSVPKKPGVNPIIILVFVIPIIAVCIAPVLVGIGYASGGGEINILTDTNTSQVNGDDNTVTLIDGKNNTVTNTSPDEPAPASDDTYAGGLECLVGAIAICGGALMIFVIMGGGSHDPYY